ncbi:hypothetical protein XOCgx_2006 [Xanthomonas oryzae pv. oryzicola]|nr:hypothetical protein XOCgx_2006 [Xanthomonas oryzae pv. oryzicola]
MLLCSPQHGTLECVQANDWIGRCMRCTIQQMR